MDSSLRTLRKSKEMTLEDVEGALKTQGRSLTVPYLSMLERGLVWPSREVVDALVELFKGEITEIEILYPFRAAQEQDNA
ncbi:helix-turn-helix domain-containing protein [Shewanella frigidimarina]|uniref:helix-turn-helix domain-containing protein n=1 Tax=Shewanella frigidimarina TaxID=56812 RepID=UPI003D7C10CE